MISQVGNLFVVACSVLTACRCEIIPKYTEMGRRCARRARKRCDHRAGGKQDRFERQA